MDPLLKDLSEKKQNFRRNVESLGAELKEVRGHLVSQEQSAARESINRQARTNYNFSYNSREINEMISTFRFSLEKLVLDT